MSTEAKVGLTVVVVLVIAGVTFLAIANVQLTGEVTTYRTYFSYIGGLDSSNVVRFGGRKAGLIETVRSWSEDLTKSEVVFTLRSELPVTEDSLATIASLSALGQNYLEILPGTIDAPRIEPGGVVPSAEPVRFSDLTNKMADVADSAVDLMGKIDAKMTVVVDDMQVLMANLQVLTGEGNQENVSRLLENSNEFLETQTPKIERVMAQLTATLESMDAMTEDFRAVARSADATVLNLNATIDEARGPLLANLTEMEGTLESAKLVIQDARALLLVNEGNVEEVIENFRRASSDLAELSANLRQRPWTLLRSSPLPDRQVPPVSGSADRGR